LVGHSRANSS